MLTVMYAKIYTSMYSGTLRGRAHEILVFTNLLAFCDRDGFVDKHPRAIAEEVGLTVEQVRVALDNLESPDPESRTPDEDGRRIVRTDEHRTWGWRIVNYEKYRAIRNEEDRRAQNKAAQARRRDRVKSADSHDSRLTASARQHRSAASAHAEAEAEAEGDADETAAQSPEPASRASDRKPRKAKPSGDAPRPRNDQRFDELWAHATKRWFEGVVTKSNRGRIAKVVHALMEYGADVSMVSERIANLRQHWRDIPTITPEALVKHWSLGANPPPPRLTPREQALEDAWKAMERSPEDVYGSEYASSNGAADGIGSDR